MLCSSFDAALEEFECVINISILEVCFRHRCQLSCALALCAFGVVEDSVLKKLVVMLITRRCRITQRHVQEGFTHVVVSDITALGFGFGIVSLHQGVVAVAQIDGLGRHQVALEEIKKILGCLLADLEALPLIQALDIEIELPNIVS